MRITSLAHVLERVPHRWRRALLGAYVAWLLVLTLAPLPESAGELPDWFDKFAHWGLFLGLAVLLYWVRAASHLHRAIGVMGWSAVLAAAIEVVQSPLPFRSGDPWDLLWGVIGAAVGYAVGHVVLGTGGG